MKKFYFLRRLSCTALLAAALPLAGGAAVGDMFTADGLSFQDLGNNEAALVKPADSDYSGQITVPATVDNGGTTYNVTTIGDGSNIVFKSGVSMVTLPEGITTLKSNAFGNNFAQYYDGEKTVALPSTLTTLESRCFNMTQITKLEIPDGVTEIPATCFPDNMNLVEVTFGSNVTTIGNNVFQNAWSLTALHIKTATPPAVSGTIFPMYASYCSVYVPTGSKAAYEEAWASQGFKEYIEEGGVMPPDPEPVGPQVGDTIQVDDGTGRMMKYEITGIDEQPTLELLNNGYSGGVIVPATVEYEDVTFAVDEIGISVFGSNVTAVELPEGITKLNYGSFDMCPITELELPSTLTDLGSNMTFFNFTKLDSLAIPDGVEVIPQHCFFSSFSLTAITLGTGVKRIDANAFKQCGGLTKLYMKATVPPTLAEDAFEEGTEMGYACPAKQVTVIVPKGSKDAYLEAWGDYGFSAIIEEGETVEPDPGPSGINEIEAGTLRYIVTADGIQLSGGIDGEATVYTLSGQVVANCSCTGGFIPVGLQPGIYLLRIGGTAIKVIVK